VSARALPWYDDAGKIGGAVLLVEVRTQERLWAGAFDHNIHGLAISDPDSMTYRSVNVAYAGLLGYRPEELQGRAIRTQYVGSEYDKLRQAVAQADATGSASVETLQLHRDGTPVPVLLDLVSLRDAQGRVVHRISTISDLRERRRTEAQLRRSEAQHLIDQRFQLVAESAPIGILLTDDAGLVSYANPVWLGIAGLSLEQARGSNPLEFVHPDDRERVRADWDRIGGRDGLDLEFRYLRPGGESRWVHSHSTAMRHTAGALLGCVHASLDITDALRERRARERTHSQVRALARRLEQLRALERAELADTLQKQFYESLAALKDGLATLRASAADPRALERLLGQAEAAQERLRRVVFDLRPPDIEELGFAAAIERYATELGAQWGLQIELSLPREPPAVPAYVLAVLYDAAREALGNVARHARATRASVAVAVNAGGISLRVSDDGIGMGEHEHHKPGCFGLLRAAERLAGIGGTLRTLGVAGSGTVVQASVPLAEHGRQGPSAGTSGSEGRGSSA
jgi:two-component system sensor histidine kinase UhpB